MLWMAWKMAGLSTSSTSGLVMPRAEEDGDGSLLHFIRVDWDPVIPLPHVDLGENRAAGLLSG